MDASSLAVFQSEERLLGVKGVMASEAVVGVHAESNLLPPLAHEPMAAKRLTRGRLILLARAE
jgi:hypothetical protein